MYKFAIKAVPFALVAAFAAGNASADELVVKIGHVAPLSGGQAHYGKDNENGAKLAIADLNKSGIKIGGKTVKWVLVSEDDAADPKQGTAVAQKLVDEKVNGVVGHLNSGTTIPASKIYFDAGIPQITPSATNPKYAQQGFKTAFRIIANDNALGAATANYAVKTLKAKKVAVIDDRTAYGQGVADEFEKGVKAAGGGTVARQFTNDKATDFTAILTRIKGAAPDLLFFGGMDTQGAPLARQLKALGCDFIDASSGGNAAAQKIPVGPGYQVEFSHRIRKEVGIKTWTVGIITEPQQAERIIAAGEADVGLSMGAGTGSAFARL